MNKRVVVILVGFALFIIIILVVWFASQKEIESSNNFATENTIASDSQPTSTSPTVDKTESKKTSSETKKHTQKETQKQTAPESFERSNYVVETQKPTYSDDEINSLAWKSFTLTIDDIDFNLPCKVTDFEKIGYKISKEFASQKVNYGYTNNPQLVKGKKNFTAYVINNSDVTLSCADCDTFGIEINLNAFSEDLKLRVDDFELSKSTTPAQITATFGTPTSQSDTPDGASILYYESKYDDETFWAFSFIDNTLTTIILQGETDV